MAKRMRDILFHEDFPAPALCSEREKFRIVAVHRNAEPQRQLFLPAGCVEGDKVGAIGIGNQRAYSFDQARWLQEFLAQRTDGTVTGRKQRQAMTCMTRADARQ